MKIATPILFYFSLTSLVLTLVISYAFGQAIGPTITRDFNFGEPLVYGLLIIQAGCSLAGMGAALKKPKS